MKGTKMLKEQTRWKQSQTPGTVKPEIRNETQQSGYSIRAEEVVQIENIINHLY